MRAYPQTIRVYLFSFSIFCCIVHLFHPDLAFSETRYVSDTLVLNLRDNIKSPFKVVATVISEDPLIILKEKDDFFFVETTEGDKGWISAQYVKTSPPKSKIIENLQAEILTLKDERDKSIKALERLQSDIESGVFTPEITAAKQEAQQLREASQTLLAEKDSLKQDYENRISRISSDLNKLQESIAQEDVRVEELTAENSRLRRYHNIYWFCAGAAVFVSGIIAGKLQTRKKKRYMY